MWGGVETALHCFGNKVGTRANSNDLRQGSLSTCPRARDYHTVSQETKSIPVCRIFKCGSRRVRVWGWGPWRSGFVHRPHPPAARDPSCRSIARDWPQPSLGSTALPAHNFVPTPPLQPAKFVFLVLTSGQNCLETPNRRGGADLKAVWPGVRRFGREGSQR